MCDNIEVRLQLFFCMLHAWVFSFVEVDEKWEGEYMILTPRCRTFHHPGVEEFSTRVERR